MGKEKRGREKKGKEENQRSYSRLRRLLPLLPGQPGATSPSPSLVSGLLGQHSPGLPTGQSPAFGLEQGEEALEGGERKSTLGEKVSKKQGRHPAWGPGTGRAQAARAQGSLNFPLPEERAPYSGERKVELQGSVHSVEAWDEKLPALAFPACRKGPAPFALEEPPQHHERLPHPGGCLPLVGHHHPPDEDPEVQVLCW